jgi:V8-like Glu-specific endopeptidase
MLMNWNALNPKEQEALAGILTSSCTRTEINWAISRSFHPGDSLPRLVGRHGKLPEPQRFQAQLRDLIKVAVERERLKSLVEKIQQMKLGYVTFRNLGHLVTVGGSTVSVSGTAGFEFQGAANQLGIVDFSALMRRLAEIKEATCRFVWSGSNTGPRSLGTGILVGDDLVLTSHHVLESHIPSDLRNSVAAPPPELSCEFDYADTDYADPKLPRALAAVASQKDWLVSCSPHDAAAQAAGRNPSSPDLLDYALVRLAGTAPPAGGKTRGFETPSNIDIGKDGMPIMVVQYPEQDPLSVSFGKTVRTQEGDARVRYDADTSGGSSGSGVYLLPTCSLISLHQGTDRGAGYNQGIPLSLILAHRKRQRL